ncbi:unnamed protein product [Rotaria sp. Silwood1]|nr:unnamed protein product [Rotaria sp. Silwood1]
MKLQIDQIDTFDAWLSQTEQRISRDLDIMEANLSGIDRQYQQLAQLQDELVGQQATTESLQNMIIVVDDSSSNDEDQTFPYTSTEIEGKLLNLSERWAHICNFVHTRWIQLQEVKIEFEQIELNHDKVDKWLKDKEDEINKMKSETNISNTDILMQQVHSIQKTESEMNGIRQSILSLDNSLKILSAFYDSTTSNELKTLNEKINNFEKRWAQLIDDLEQCSTRLKKLSSNFEKNTQTNIKPTDDSTQKTTTTTTTTVVEETTTTTTNAENPDDSINKKRKINRENTMKSDFDLSARKYIDWIDNIERILAEKPSKQLQSNERELIIQEVKTKYLSYDDQFKVLIQTGNIITKQLKDANEDSSEHETTLNILENRWQELHQQILKCEQDIEQSKFNDEIQTLTKIRNEYQTWIDSTPESSSNTEYQAKLTSFQTYNERLAHLKRMADRFDTNTFQRTNDLLRSWDDTHSRLRERTIPVEHMQQQTSGITSSSTATSFRQTGTTSIPVSPIRSEINEQSSSTATTTTTNLGPSIGENGSVFTLTNIYTFGGNDGSYNNGSSDVQPDKYRVKSFVEVFDQPSSQQDSEYERRYRESHSSSVTRKIRTSATDTYDYGQNGGHESSLYQHNYETTSPSSIRCIHDTSYSSILPTIFTDTQRKLRIWLEYVEPQLVHDKARVINIHAINMKKKVYKDLLDQTFEQEHHLESLNKIANEYYSKLTIDVSRRLEEELINYRDRLNDIKMFLSDRLTKSTNLDKTLNDFESGIEEVRVWIRNAQTRLVSDTTSYGLENQMDRSQTLQHEIRDMQTIINGLNRDIIELTRDADENLARRLREEIRQLNESWSHFISSTKTYSQNIQNQFIQLKSKFRQFQKPSDFEPKYAKMRQILYDVEQNMYTLEIRSDDPDVIHNQLEHCLKLYKTLSDIKSDVEYVIRIGRSIVEKGQTDESNELIRQMEQLKTTYNTLGAKVSTSRNQLDNVERHLRKFRKEYSHIHEWFVKADHEIRKIENKQVSKNTKEEIDWIRTTRNDIRKLEANFEVLRNLERTIQKDAERLIPSLHEKISELKRQIDQLDRRLKDRSDIVEISYTLISNLLILNNSVLIK